ncbi:MAG: hypothetical protein V4594_11010 [Bacteroidota bacterium]
METTNNTDTTEETNDLDNPKTGLQNIEGEDDNLNLGGEEDDDPELNHDEDDDLSLNVEDDIVKE